MGVEAIASMATGMKQAEFQQQVGIAVAKKAMDLQEQTGADLALLLNSAPVKGASAPGVGTQLDVSV